MKKPRKVAMVKRSNSLIGNLRTIVSFDRLDAPIKKVRSHKRGTQHFINHYTDQRGNISAVELKKGIIS